MSADWAIGTHTPERIALAGELIETGRSVSFGDFELHTSPRAELVVSVVARDTLIPSDIDAIKANIAGQVDVLLRENPTLAPLERLPRLYELVLDWGKGGTWLGFWSETGFQRDRPGA